VIDSYVGCRGKVVDNYDNGTREESARTFYSFELNDKYQF